MTTCFWCDEVIAVQHNGICPNCAFTPQPGAVQLTLEVDDANNDTVREEESPR